MSPEQATVGRASHPARRGPRSPIELLEIAAEMILDGAQPMDLARKLSIPYPRAARLHEQVYAEVYGRIEEGYSPDVLKVMKDELTEKLIKVIHNCERAVERTIDTDRPITKPYTQLLAATRQLAAIRGFNAPTASVSFEHRSYSWVTPEVHDRIMSDPRARAALLALEEFAADQEPPGIGGDG